MALAVSGTSRSENSVERYSETGEICIKAQDTSVCMKSYGFQCHQIRMPNKSIEAYILGCNMALSNGVINYLGSCRILTENELQAIKSCLAEGLPSRSEEYAACLREAGVKVGCDEQADGSRICY